MRSPLLQFTVVILLAASVGWLLSEKGFLIPVGILIVALLSFVAFRIDDTKLIVVLAIVLAMGSAWRWDIIIREMARP